MTDAETAFAVWWKDHWDEYFNEAGSRHIYFAGHAAALCEAAAAPVDEDALRTEFEKWWDSYEHPTKLTVWDKHIAAEGWLARARSDARAKVAEAECERLRAALVKQKERVADMECECDAYHGFKCCKHAWLTELEGILNEPAPPTIEGERE